MRLADSCLTALALSVLLLTQWSVSAAVPTRSVMRPVVKVAPLSLPIFVHRGVLSRGETLGQLATKLGVPPAELPAWLSAVRRVLDTRSLPVGLGAEAVIDVHGSVRVLRLTPDWRTRVVAARGDDGVRAVRQARPVERELIVVEGTVQSSLFDAFSTTGESESLALELADLFQWDVDFHREVREGDQFALLVERVRAAGQTVAYGPVLAASYTNRGSRYTAVRYAFGGHHESYYDERGRPLRKQFLRAPLRFTRVTSRFSRSRMHPILHRRLPHWGVDYGAPVGTPVMATADGVVTYTGWHDGGGRMVQIRHAGAFVTTYLHLSRFAAGIHRGVRVSQGQVIGFVGSSGLSTGPHLDYRVTQNGRHLNPLTVGKEPAPPLPKDQLPGFLAWAGRVLPLLDRPGTLPRASVATLQAAAPIPLDG
jgi:murein DD-endopeptidase MepM/ murein hydrolase activator NlpD